MMKKTFPLILILAGTAVLITAIVFWVNSLASGEPESFGQSLRDWTTLIIGIGTSIKGWIDLLKKESPSQPTKNVNSGNILSGTVEKVGEDFVGGDKVVNTYFSEDVSYNVEGLPNPYLGLRAFTYKDRDLYTGREKLVDEALQALVTVGGQRELLFVTGASGSGKSSFVQAGLLPAIIKHYEEKNFRVDFVAFRPSLAPREKLFKAIRDLSSREVQIIIIDQFEELFTQSMPSERNAVLRYLSNLEVFEISRRHIVVTLRSDYLGEIHDNPVLYPIATHGIPLRAMKVHEIKAVIQLPLYIKYPHKNKRFDPKLVEKLAQDAAESVTYLPLLQVTLEEIWNKGRLQLSEYNSLIDSIKERADTVLAYRDFDNASPQEKRSSKEREQMITILLDLVNVSLEKEARHDTGISRERSEFTEGQQKLLDDLSKARLISIDREDDKDIVNLIHETLLQNWDVLQNGIKEKRVQLENRVNFETHLREWIKRNRSDDYLLKKDQVSEVQELEKAGDIALSKKEAQDFLQSSIRKLDADTRRDYILSTLFENFITLSSTLELEPLLQKILEKAVGISDCEAGILILVDDKTGDLVFRVGSGFVCRELVEQKISFGDGIFGRVAQSHAPFIDNANLNPLLPIENPDNKTDLIAKFVLAVPMLIKDRLIGIIVVINKKNSLPFVSDDQNWLVLFSNQAAAAVESARLHALADQEHARMEKELQDYKRMQRIERQLSSSVDVDQAAEITLEWAMRQPNVEAGLIGMIENNHLRLMVRQKYRNQFIEHTKEILELDSAALVDVIESGQSSQVSLVATGEQGTFPTAHYRLIVPIRREAQVIGLLLLESTSDLQMNLAFLNRLCDYAAITISKAQLYDEAQRASLAKSDFVSFVAHELKNPMGSIKGYTELLTSGAVGQINEMQTNFLHTIKSNVERMYTLVSDLNDNSKIEAGRLRLEYKATSAPDLVDEVVRSIKRQIEEKKQILEIVLPEKISPMWADRIRVGQVLTNLMDNAHKYTPEGGRVVLGAEAKIDKSESEDAQQVVHLWVRDNGIGISVEDQPKIFEKFFRSMDSKAREMPGTGLGLNITKSLVEMMGGRIWFESEFRKGSTFHFTIPVAEE